MIASERSDDLGPCGSPTSPTALPVHAEIDHHGRLVATMLGELDADRAPRLVTLLAERPVPVDVVDCRFVSRVSPAGLRSLIGVNRPADRIVTGPTMARTAARCGLTSQLDHVSTALPPALDRAPFGAAIHDADLRYRYVNERLAEINALPAPAHIGRTGPELFDPLVDEVTPILADVVSTGRTRHHMVDAETPTDHTALWCSYLPVELDDGPGVVALVQPPGVIPIGGAHQPEARVSFRRGAAS